MPFESKAQQGYMYAHPEILGKKGLAEWSASTDFSKLPQKKKKFIEKRRSRGKRS